MRTKILSIIPTGAALIMRAVLSVWVLHYMTRISLLLFVFGVVIGSASGQKPEIVVQTGHSSQLDNLALTADGRFLVTGGDSGSVKLWDMFTRGELRTFEGFTAHVNVAISADGSLIAGISDESVKIWNVQTGNELASFTYASKKVLKDEGHSYTSNTLTDVVFSPDGRYLAATAQDGDVQLWDLHELRPGRKLTGSTQWAGDPVFSPDGNRLAATSGDHAVIVWDVTQGKQLYILRGETNAVFTTAFNHDGTLLATNDDKTAHVWSAANGRLLKSFVGHKKTIGAAKFLNKDNKLVTSDEDGNFKFWDLETGVEEKSLAGPSDISSFVIVPDDRLIVSSSFNMIQISFLEIETGRRMPSMTYFHPGMFLQFSENSEFLLVRYQSDLMLFGTNDATPRRFPSMYGGGYFWPTAISKDVSQMVAAGGKTAKIWDIASGAELKIIEEPNEIINAFFNTDSTKLLLMMSGPKGGVDPIVSVWDTKSFSKLLSTTDSSQVSAVAKDFRVPDLHSRSSESRDRSIRAEIGTKGEVVLINNGTHKDLCRIYLVGDGWLIATPDGFFDGTPGAWKQLIWRFNNNTFDYGAVELYFNDFFYPGLLKDVMAGKVPKPEPGQELEKIDRRQPTVVLVSVDGQSKEQATSKTVTEKRTTTVSIDVTDNNSAKKQPEQLATSGARDLRLFRNGSLVKVWHGDVFKLAKDDGCEQRVIKQGEPRHVRCTAEVAVVTGANNFTSYAFNSSNVKSNDASAAIEGKAAKRDGTLYVLEVGIDKYAASGKGEGRNFDLNYAVADIDAIGQALTEQQAALKQKQYAATKVISLKNENATKANILLALGRFAKEPTKAAIPDSIGQALRDELAKIVPLQPEDGLIIYYAGHGTARCVTDEKSRQTNCDRFYLVPHDGFPPEKLADDKAWKNSLYQHSISDEELSAALENVDAGKMVMVIDACNSGAIEGEETRRGPMNSRGLAQLAYEKGMDVLTASQGLEFAKEGLKVKDKQGNIVQMNHGLLTYTLLQAFGDKDANKDDDDKLTISEWLNYAVAQVPQLQLDAIKFRNAEIVHTGKKDLPPEQTPRLFTRREADPSPFIVGRP